MKTFFAASFGAPFGTLAAFVMCGVLLGARLQFVAGPAIRAFAQSAGFDSRSMKDFAEMSKAFKQFMEKMKTLSPAELQRLQSSPDVNYADSE